MKNTALLDKNQYFVESKKAIQIVLEKERIAANQIKMTDKLKLVKEQKDNTESLDEYEELEKLEKELERKIRFNQFTEPAVPEEHRAKLKRNAAAEQLVLDQKLNELKSELTERIQYLDNELMPLLANISKLESMKTIPDQLDTIINSEIGEGIPISLSHRLQVYKRTETETKAGQAMIGLENALKILKKIEVPTETKGLMDFLKKGGKK